MSDVFVDFETRSLVDLRKTGAWKYAAHESTYPLMLAAFYPESGRKLQWLEYEHGRECPSWVRGIAEDDNLTVHAHNANFEIAIWERVLVERWGWPTIPRRRWKDTAGLAANANLPRSLSAVGDFLNIKNAKDKSGAGLIKSLSVPQKALKKQIDGGTLDLFELDPDQGAVYYWNNDKKELKKFAAYNERDVVAECEVDSLLPDYTGVEAKMWELDSIINERGLPIDVELCEAAVEVFEWIYDRCESDIQALTASNITRPTQAAKILKWVNERVSIGQSLSKEVVEWWLEANPNPSTKAESEVSAILNIRQVSGGSAIKKYAAALQVAEDDNRARGQFLYFGASTGRWAGRGIQPHNFFRQSIPDESVFDIIKRANYSEITEYADENDTTVATLVRSCIRGLICAPEGYTLNVSDFAGIESRVLQWLVGNEEALQLFRDGSDMYVHTAAKMYGLDYKSMMNPDGKVKKEHKEHRQIGKAAVLGLGYQMGSGRFLGELLKNGIDADEAFASSIVQKWRTANPLIACRERGIWYRLERAFKAAVKSRNTKFGAVLKANGDDTRWLRVVWEGFDVVTIQLPSGRKMYYPDSHLVDGKFGPSIRYRDGGKNLVDTYGGCLVENVVQAVSRDLLVNSMFEAEAAGLKVIGHVHDEIIVESKEERQEVEHDILHRCMSTVPNWAKGLPLAAETFSSRRYTK